MADTLHLEIVTAGGAAVDTQAQQVTLPLADGEAGILPGHAPLLGALVSGVVRYTFGGAEHYCAVSPGTVNVAANTVTVLARTAEPAPDIDLPRAEAALRRAKEQGAELVCFGDIDMENNRAWGEERCRNVGLEAVYPLWHHDRQENVREVLELGYRCLIKTLDRRVLPRHLLGRVMDRAMVEEMTACGVDICGENGEFHTIAVDGPVFHRPIPYCVRQLLDLGDYSVADITVPEKE